MAERHEGKTKPGAEYTVEQAKSFIEKMSGEYALARIVDPIECRIIGFDEDGGISADRKCYGIWNAGHKCAHCSSAASCKTGRAQRKTELFDGKLFDISSEPVTLRLADGASYHAVVELVDVEEVADGAGIAGEVNDREAENVDHAASQYQAAHDDLTGVLDADTFYELARDMIMKDPGRPWVMATANIMNFRLVNTLFGDLRGNEVLIRTAALLKQQAIKGGGVCGRIGGDQFALLLPRAAYDEQDLLNVRKALSNDFSSGIYTFVIHFGVYHVTDAVTPISIMCGRANSALRTIRENVRETIAYFDEGMLERTIFEQSVIAGFTSALDGGQFKMYLQPLVNADGDAFGCEVLARWVKPDGTVIMPGEFIEVLEQAGFIHELDAYIWERAVKQLAEWRDTPCEDLVLSVNMSAKDLFSTDVYHVLCGLVDQYGVDAAKLKVEITETALLEETANSKAVIEKLSERGFATAIDDFGKGYSSLSMLKDVRADVLKIDRSLIAEIEDEPRTRVILGAVINMAHDLGMDVITEGVETADQLEVLVKMGCRCFQGYYFARPMPADEFERNRA